MLFGCPGCVGHIGTFLLSRKWKNLTIQPENNRLFNTFHRKTTTGSSGPDQIPENDPTKIKSDLINMASSAITTPKSPKRNQRTESKSWIKELKELAFSEVSYSQMLPLFQTASFKESKSIFIKCSKHERGVLIGGTWCLFLAKVKEIKLFQTELRLEMM